MQRFYIWEEQTKLPENKQQHQLYNLLKEQTQQKSMKKNRVLSRSNQALNLAISTSDSQRMQTPHKIIQHILNNQLTDRELFKQSYNKIQKLKAILTRKSSKELMQQLNDVIDLIRGERAKAKITIDDLHALVNNNSDPFKNELYKDSAMNTDELLPESFDENIDEYAQTQCYQQQQMTKQQIQIKNKQKKYQCYYKIVCMVNKMKVDYREILPIIPNLPQKYILPNVDDKLDRYKILKPQQKIKLQKVFINKLNCMTNNQYYRAKQLKQEMITSQINNNNNSDIILKTPQKENKYQESNSNTTEGSVSSELTKSTQQTPPHQQRKIEKLQKQQKLQQKSHQIQKQVRSKPNLNNKLRSRQKQRKQKSHSKSKQKQQLHYRIRDKKPTFYQLNRKRVM